MLFENVESILNSVCYSFENDFTLDSDNVADEIILSENDVNMKSNDDVDGDGGDKYDDDTFALDENFSIENEKEDVVRNEFSIEYMANVVNFFWWKRFHRQRET